MLAHADPVPDAVAQASAAGPPAAVFAVCRSPRHSISKPAQAAIRLLAGLGVDGDAHCSATVKHRYLAARDPARPNLRQVHLVARECLAGLVAAGFRVAPGALGENITTAGLDLAGLPYGTRLHLGGHAIVELTGLRDPCRLIDRVAPGLMQAVTGHTAAGAPMVRGAVMAIVLAGGDVLPGDTIAIVYPPPPLADLPVV